MKQSLSSYAVPSAITHIVETLKQRGFLAYLVGGCVRDMLRGVFPKDWDVATSATPEEIQAIFPDSVYENHFGTVGVKVRSDEQEKAEVVEVTTFRKEMGYSDKRHPDRVIFAQTIEDDLSRRDFTVNAMAADVKDGEVVEFIDPFGGRDDFQKKQIRCVGEPKERFAEDALRMMRAVRFVCQLGFELEGKTADAILQNAEAIKHIAWERIRDEFEKIILSERAAQGVQLLFDLGLLPYIAPELTEGIDIEQNLHHIYTVWEHNLRALAYAAEKDYSLEVRLASLLHDIGKPRAKKGEGKYATFHNHEVLSARMAKEFLERLRFSRRVIEDVTHLVRRHQFYYNTGEISEAGVRRFIKRVGMEYVDALLQVREADRIGSGVPKAFPYKLRHLQFMIDKVRRDPISPKMLQVNGEDIMKVAELSPSPKVGMIQNILLDEILEDPSLNTKEYLEQRIKELSSSSVEDLQKQSRASKEKQEVLEGEAEEELKKRHWVK